MTVIVRCGDCGKRTTLAEAIGRLFRTGWCAYCGGELFEDDEKGAAEATPDRHSLPPGR